MSSYPQRGWMLTSEDKAEAKRLIAEALWSFKLTPDMTANREHAGQRIPVPHQ